MSENIFENALGALRGISRANGFASDVELVRTGPLPPGAVPRFPAIVAQILRERTASLPARRRRRVMRLQITAHVRGADAAAARAAMGALQSDIDRALMADPTRGGHAVMTEAVERSAESTSGESGLRAAAIYDIVSHENI